MGRRVVFRPAGERDLAALYAYIRDDRGDPEVAIAYVRRMRGYWESAAPVFPRSSRIDA
jgi:plasmid stabilization system protein ParE